jgi:hypothetical protein
LSDKKKVRTQEGRSAKEGGDLKLADEAFKELKGKNFSEAGVLGRSWRWRGTTSTGKPK